MKTNSLFHFYMQTCERMRTNRAQVISRVYMFVYINFNSPESAAAAPSSIICEQVKPRTFERCSRAAMKYDKMRVFWCCEYTFFFFASQHASTYEKNEIKRRPWMFILYIMCVEVCVLWFLCNDFFYNSNVVCVCVCGDN